MIDIKIMKEIAEKSQLAVKGMTVLHSMKKRNMKYDVDTIMIMMQQYDDLCKEIQKLANEN